MDRKLVAQVGAAAFAVLVLWQTTANRAGVPAYSPVVLLNEVREIVYGGIFQGAAWCGSALQGFYERLDVADIWRSAGQVATVLLSYATLPAAVPNGLNWALEVCPYRPLVYITLVLVAQIAGLYAARLTGLADALEALYRAEQQYSNKLRVAEGNPPGTYPSLLTLYRALCAYVLFACIIVAGLDPTSNDPKAAAALFILCGLVGSIAVFMAQFLRPMSAQAWAAEVAAARRRAVK